MRLISLASGTLPEFEPEVVVESAAAAGFGGCGVWFDPDSWTPPRVARVRRVFEQTGLTPLEMEVLVVGDQELSPHVLRQLDAASEVGVREVLTVSREPDPVRNLEAFGRLAEAAEERDLYLSLEFLPIFAVSTLASALAVIQGVSSDRLKLLVDPLHVVRTGLDPAALNQVPRGYFRFCQFCDASFLPPHDGTFAALYDEALNGRLLPGEGDLPLAQMLEAMPEGLPLSLEIRSRALRDRYPDPIERCRAVLDAMEAWLEAHGLRE